MNGYIVTTEVGYSVYVGPMEIADVNSYNEAIAALKESSLWNGSIVRSMSSFMPCN